MKLPIKGFLLQSLFKAGECWDDRLIDEAFAAYGLSGRQWHNTLSVALDELASAGLTERRDFRLSGERLGFCYRLSDFGRQRMRDTGLLPEGAA